MIRPKNISELNPDTCKLLLYGYVGIYEDISSAQFVQDLDYASQFYKNCEVHINSGGGDVYEGVAMFNALRQSKMNISIYIDGIAASIASVIAMCGRPVYMSKYALWMIHSVSGGMYGNVTDMQKVIEGITTVENIIVNIIAERTGLPTDDVKLKWFDGQDHWLSANDALELGLVNEIYDGAPVALPEGENNPKRLTNLFNNVLKPFEMKWENFFKRFGLRNEATEEEAIDTVAKIEKRAADAEAENATLKTQNADLAKKLADKEAAEAVANEAEITAAVENATKEGRIQDAQKAQYTAILKADKVNGLAVLNSLPKARRIMDSLEQKQSDEREKWNFEDWSKKDPKGLANMKANDKDRYQSLFNAKYKKA